jgi:ribosome-associated protein
VIEIKEDLLIPEHELSFTFSRSSKPGGQKVNKVSTRVTLLFDVQRSPSLTERQRARILARLQTRITKNGILRVVSQKYRTQGANRGAVIERFADLLREALSEQPPRKKRRVPKEVRERRLRDKKRRSLLKRERTKIHEPTE